MHTSTDTTPAPNLLLLWPGNLEEFISGYWCILNKNTRGLVVFESNYGVLSISIYILTSPNKFESGWHWSQLPATTFKFSYSIHLYLITNFFSVFRKHEGKIKTATAFCVLLGQKFMSIFVTKIFLYGKLPRLQDQTFTLLLAIHLFTFLFFHETPVKDLMMKYRKNEYRRVIQETFKGYGKGLNLFILVNKGLEL